MPILSKRNGLIIRQLDDELIILNTETGYIHVLNSMGALIWCLLDDHLTIDDIIYEIKKEFPDTDITLITHDAKKIIGDMIEHQILDLS